MRFLLVLVLAAALAAVVSADERIWKKARAVNADIHRCLVRCGLVRCEICERKARP